ncbi:MAG: DNA repair helicase XPB [Actinomycetota bacterium]
MDRPVSGPLVVQSDRTLLLDVGHPDADECRRELAVFAELESSPEHVHTYRVGDLGIWNARAAGHEGPEMVEVLERWSRFPVPHPVITSVLDTAARFGVVQLVDDPRHGLVLRSDDEAVLAELLAEPSVAELLGPRVDGATVVAPAERRGALKQALMAAGWPPEDRAALDDGAPIDVAASPSLELRDYQRAAVDGWAPSGSGVVVLPCGAGKTIVAIAAMVELGRRTLILTTGNVAVEQWRRELRRFTDLGDDDIGEYSGRDKRLAPVTIATYQIMATRRSGRFLHLPVVRDHDWGLIVYDEVHLLPAGVVRMTADLQSRRRLGLTATLVREDGREADVFSLIGPKRFDAPWRDLELQGWIAPATCTEVRVPLTEDQRATYAAAASDRRPLAAAAAAGKVDVVRRLVADHAGEQLLVIGTYVASLVALAEQLGAPVLTGDTPTAERQRRLDELRSGELEVLVVSSVGNTSLDLPEVSVLVQVSGTFGSRQEEAQRLGRILRPKREGRTASFYSLVARDTVEQDHAPRRQRFLTEQGYEYRIVDAADVLAGTT